MLLQRHVFVDVTVVNAAFDVGGDSFAIDTIDFSHEFSVRTFTNGSNNYCVGSCKLISVDGVHEITPLN
jgi:hypothetical protein